MPLDTTKTISINGINVYDEGTRERWSKTDSNAVRTLTCAWSDRIALIAELLGQATGSGAIEDITDASGYPDATFMRVDSIEPEGVGLSTVGPNGMIAYEYARLTVNYRPLRLDFSAAGTGSYQVEVGSDVLTVPQGAAVFKWASDNVDVTPEASPNLQVSTARISIPRRNIPRLDGKAIPILALTDHVNSEVLFGAAVGTMLYKGFNSFAKTVPTTNSTASEPDSSDPLEAFDLLHTLLFRNVPWNYFLRPSTGTWVSIVYKATGAPYFPSANLNAIFDIGHI